MNKNEKRAYEIIELGKQLTAEKQRRSAAIRRTVYSVSGLCAAIIGLGIWNSNAVKNAPDPRQFTSVSEAAKSTTETAVSTTDTVPTTQKTTTVVAETMTSKVTSSVTTAERTYPQTVQTAQTTAINTEPSVASEAVTSELQTTAVTSENAVSTTTELPANPIENPDAYCICNLKKFMGNNYSSNEKVTVQQEKIGKLIGSAEVELGYYRGYKGHDEDITANTEIYSVNDFSENFAVAVRYSDEGNYYIYNNNYYFPETLDALINDCGFEKYLKIRSAEYQDKEPIYLSVENEDVWDMLFDEREIAAHRISDFPPDKYISRLTLVCELPEIYDAPFGIGISEKGIITIKGIAFDIGEDKTNKFIDHIIKKEET